MTLPSHTSLATPDPDYDHLMRANLARVFSEPHASLRSAAIRELYADDAVLYEPQAAVHGHAAIEYAVTRLLDSLPPGFVFSATGPAVGHHGAGCLQWQGGPAGGPVVVTGSDVALVEGNLIKALYVFIDPSPA
jgi:hypothetical protein